MTNEDLSERLLEFAARVGKVVDALPDSRLGRHIAGPLVRSGTSPAPNYEEACAAESTRVFVSKLSICLGNLHILQHQIGLLIKVHLLPKARLSEVLDESTQLCKIIVKSVVTTKTNQSSPKET